jgi:hypothetical protein
MRRILLMSSFFVAAAALPLAAEEISLKDGTKIVGHMTSVSSDKIEVETSYGKMQLKRSDILDINFPENGAGTSATSGTSNNTAPSTAASVKRDGQSIDDSLQGTQYLNRTGKFSLTLPPNWKINTSLVRSPQTMGGVSSRDEMRFVLVSREEYTGSLESYKGLGDIQARRSLENYEELSSSPITIDGKAGVLVSYRGTMPKAQNLPVQFMVAIFPSSNGYTRIAAWCVEPLFHEMQPTFERILTSYHSAEGNSRSAQLSKP